MSSSCWCILLPCFIPTWPEELLKHCIQIVLSILSWAHFIQAFGPCSPHISLPGASCDLCLHIASPVLICVSHVCLHNARSWFVSLFLLCSSSYLSWALSTELLAGSVPDLFSTQFTTLVISSHLVALNTSCTLMSLKLYLWFIPLPLHQSQVPYCLPQVSPVCWWCGRMKLLTFPSFPTIFPISENVNNLCAISPDIPNSSSTYNLLLPMGTS